MNNSMVAHLWANEKKESARGSNFFFEGRSIYSYGYHFEVGRIVRNKCGKKAYLLNDKYYSSSTCKHQQDLLEDRVARIAKMHEDESYTYNMNDNYWCATCGSHSHKKDSKTGYCWYCDTVNWVKEDGKDVGI